MNLAGRQGPSGPKVELQLPFYGATGIDGAAPGTYYLAVGTGTAQADAPDRELELAFFIPQRGTLGTLLVANVATGTDPVNITYQARKKGKHVGSSVVIGNLSAGPMKVDLSNVGVAAGDWVTVQVTVPAFGGTAPVPKIVFTWFPAGN